MVAEQGPSECSPTPTPIDVEMVLVDWPAALYKHLRAGGENWPANTVWPHSEDEIVKAVNADQLATLAREWVQQDEVQISEAYATVEAPAEIAPNPTEGLLNVLNGADAGDCGISGQSSGRCGGLEEGPAPFRCESEQCIGAGAALGGLSSAHPRSGPGLGIGRPLGLRLPEEIDQADRCNLFCLTKPDGELRQIYRPPPMQ